MPRRKPRFVDKPHTMSEDLRKKFQVLIDKGKEKPSRLPEPKWLFDGTEKMKQD